MPASRQSDGLLIALAAALVSILSFIYFLRTDQILLYGDAVAHINIARRIFDSQTPGLLQLGTVWLPLPHLLMIPFIVSDSAWRTGAGASLPSMAAFVLGAIGIYRLTFSLGSRLSAWIAALAFIANPNLIYMQSTAMTECIALAAMIWATVYLVQFAQQLGLDSHAAIRTLQKCALALAAGILTRYDGWFYSGCVGIVVIVLWCRSAADVRRTTRRALLQFLGLCVVTLALWLAFNYEVYANPLEFLNGPYSARAIAARTTRPGDAPHPGHHSVTVAAVYFQKAAKLNLANGWTENLLLLLALAGAASCAATRKQRVVLLLWSMLPFYALSIAYGGVPIFMPQWWPHSYYNVRYGLQLLPAIIVSAALLAEAAILAKWRNALVGMVSIVFLLGCIGVWRSVPICLLEARVNARTRIAFERELAEVLQRIPEDQRLMMYTGSHVGALQRVGIPLRRVLHEGNWPIWDEAMNDPKKYADVIIAMDGDPLAACAARNRDRLQSVAVIHTVGQPPATVYRILR